MAVRPEPIREPGTRAPRPRDAATLIIYRERKGQIEVLMGRRHRKHKFLPQRFVFPGGAVDPTDSRVRPATPIREDVQELLQRRARASRVPGLVAAAIRETFEEAGLIIGKPDPEPGRSVPKNWRPFFETGMAPAFGDLDYIARAVTPHWRPIRFNARFFMVDAKNVSGDLTSNGELLDLTYFPLAETADLELPLITTRVLEIVEENARNPVPPGNDRKAILFQHNGKFHDMIPE